MPLNGLIRLMKLKIEMVVSISCTIRKDIFIFHSTCMLCASKYPSIKSSGSIPTSTVKGRVYQLKGMYFSHSTALKVFVQVFKFRSFFSSFMSICLFQYHNDWLVTVMSFCYLALHHSSCSCATTSIVTNWKSNFEPKQQMKCLCGDLQ